MYTKERNIRLTMCNVNGFSEKKGMFLTFNLYLCLLCPSNTVIPSSLIIVKIKMVITFPFFSLGVNGDLDLGFILDGSGSINHVDAGNWQRLLEWIGQVISRLPEHGTQVGVVVFSTTAELRIKLNEHHTHASLINAINNLYYPSKHTNIADGLHIASTQLFNEQNGDRKNVPNVAVLIADGQSRLDVENTMPNARALHRAGIQIIAIGISNAISEDEIRAISSPPHTKDMNYFLRSGFQSLQDLTDTLAERIKESSKELTTQNTLTTNGDDGEC